MLAQSSEPLRNEASVEVEDGPWNPMKAVAGSEREAGTEGQETRDIGRAKGLRDKGTKVQRYKGTEVQRDRWGYGSPHLT